jgi:uncharacterized cupin superfamily protein
MPESRRHPNVVNLDEVSSNEESHGGFGHKRRRLGAEAGGKALGCGWFEIPPGKTAFPHHFHSAFEEALYVLEGAGEVRVGGERVAIRAGDYAAFPAGPERAHAVTNTGTGPLRYLALSSPATPATLDIVVYPDSKKVAFASGVDPVKGFRGGTWVMKLIKEDQPALGYYDGEPLADG